MSRDLLAKLLKIVWAVFSVLGPAAWVFAKWPALPGNTVVHFADSFSSFHQNFVGNWFSLLHFASNAVVSWRLDLISEALLRYGGFYDLFAGLMLILCVGVFLLFHALNSNGDSWATPSATLCLGLSILSIFGLDTVILSSLAWFPWLLLLLYFVLLKGRTSLPYILLLVFFAIRIAKASNQYSLILVGISLFFIWYLGKWRDEQVRRGLLWLCLIITLAPALYVTLLVPEPPLPSYPAYSRVLDQRVPLLAGSDALIGPLPPFEITPVQVIDRAFLRENFKEPTLALFALSLVLYVFLLFQRSNSDSRARGLSLGVVCLSGACLLDTSFFRSELSQIAPLYSLSRIIPGLNYFPVIYLVYALSIFFFVMVLVLTNERKVLALLSFFALLSLGFIGKAVLVKEDGAKSFEELRALSLESAERERISKILVSPSYALIQELGLFYVKEHMKAKPNVNVVPLSNFNPFLRASNDEGVLRHLVLTKEGQRWGSGSGRQNGNEWIHISFDQAIILRGIKLELGSFSSDFPRGLEVLVSDSCQRDSIDYSAYKSVFRREHWKGEVSFTDAGFPYRDAEANVTTLFDSSVTAQCMLIRQIGESVNFEWSLTGVRILR